MSNFLIEGPGGIPQIKLQGGYNSKLPITTTAAITGGSISASGTSGLSAAAGSDLHILDNGAASATAGAATLARVAGKITSESLTTAAGAIYTLTITDTSIAAADLVFASVDYGTATTGEPVIERVSPSAGQLVVTVRNVAASAALNGTIVVTFWAVKTT